MKRLFLSVFTCFFCFTAAAQDNQELYSPAYGLWQADTKTGNLFRGLVHITPVRTENNIDAPEMLLISDADKKGLLCSGDNWENKVINCSLVNTTKINVIPEENIEKIISKIEPAEKFIIKLEVSGNTLKIKGHRSACMTEGNCHFEELSSLTREQFANPLFYKKLRPFSLASWETHLTPTKKLTRNIEGYEVEENCWLYENRDARVSMVCIMEYPSKNLERLFYTYKIIPCITQDCIYPIEIREECSDKDALIHNRVSSRATFYINEK